MRDLDSGSCGFLDLVSIPYAINLGFHYFAFCTSLQIHRVAIGHFRVPHFCRETQLLVDGSESFENFTFLRSGEVLPSVRLRLSSRRLCSSSSRSNSTSTSRSTRSSSSTAASSGSRDTLPVNFGCGLEGLLFSHLSLGSVSALFPYHSRQFHDFRRRCLSLSLSLLSVLQACSRRVVSALDCIFLIDSQLNLAGPAR